MTTTTLRVTGMTCGHCVAEVARAIAALEGVRGVDVDLAGGSASVQSDGPIILAAVEAALGPLGFQVSPCADAIRWRHAAMECTTMTRRLEHLCRRRPLQRHAAWHPPSMGTSAPLAATS